jgi:hypothetical protein
LVRPQTEKARPEAAPLFSDSILIISISNKVLTVNEEQAMAKAREYKKTIAASLGLL